MMETIDEFNTIYSTLYILLLKDFSVILGGDVSANRCLRKISCMLPDRLIAET